MCSNRVYSPLRYPGGKAPFAPFIAEVVQKNGFLGGHYMEPYAGGAGVALELLFHGYVSHIHINDADPAIYDFWVSVTKHPYELLNLLESTPITIEEWFKWRSILRRETKANVIERGFATLFINRTNRSGILKGGVIGGKGQNGNYKLDARFKKDVIAGRILAIAKHSHSITVYCEDSLNLLKQCSHFLPKKSLIYLDPPYYIKGKGLYRNYYEHNDHVAIAEKLQQKGFKWAWIVSYDNTEEIRALYQLSQSLSYGLNYTAQRRYIGREIMFFRQDLIVPDTRIPQTKMAS